MAPARVASAAVLVALLASGAYGSALEEAERVYAEGKKILAAARAEGGDVVKGSHAAIAKFVAAAAMLGEPPDGSREADLLQDINSMIFWTRRTTPMDMSDLLGGGGGGAPAGAGGPSAGSTEGAPKQDASALAREAPTALARAEAYAAAHPEDHMSCAARFFEVADRYKDFDDVAFKAISRAQEFQRLGKEAEARREAEAEFESLPPAERLTVEGDRAYAAKRYDEAAAKYGEAVKLGRSPERYRKLGHAFFGRAQAFREEYTRAYLAARRAYNDAIRRNDGPGATRAAERARAAGQIATRARGAYQQAEVAFQSARNASPGRLDLDSDIHIALANLIRRKPTYVAKAAEMFEKILLTYHDKLADDQDRTLYALAETYAGAATVARVRETIARRLRAQAGTAASGAGEQAAGRPLSELSDKELRAEHSELKEKLKRDEIRLKSSQLSGAFDKDLLDLVNAERKRLEEIKEEASRRGLR